MVKLLIDVRDVLGPQPPETIDTHPDDKVVVWAPVHRTTVDLGIVTPRKRDIPLTNGRGEHEVEPGPLWVKIQSGAVDDPGPWLVEIPEDETEVSLAKVLEGAFTHTPAVQYRVGDYAMRAEKVARELESAAYSAHWEDDRLTVMGKTSQPLTGPKGDKGDKGDPGDVSTTQLNAALVNKADLVDGRVPAEQIPDVALTRPFSVVNRAQMLALQAEEGDVAIIEEAPDKGPYMLGTGSPTVFESWYLLAAAGGDTVKSVNDKTGVVVLNAGDVGAAPSDHAHSPQQVGAAPAVHEHTFDQVPGLQEALGEKLDTDTIQIVDVAPETRTPGVFYFVKEA